MNTFHAFAPLAKAFGLSVAHSLWQIALIWLIFKLLEWRFSRKHQLVYLLSLTAMIASSLWAAFTFFTNWSKFKLVASEEVTYQEVEPVFYNTVVTTGPGSELSLWQTAQLWLEGHAALIGWAWLVCAGLLWLRLMGGWWLAQRIRQRDVRKATTGFQELCTNWAKRLNITSKIALLESPHISEPLTLGFWKPVVLFPAGMLLQLSPAQVEALLLHELAHIRRYDYLVNLFQLALEVCFFYHPLFWLLSREARSRREFCCDEVVLRHTSDPILYAKTLTDLQLSFLQPSTQFVMNATGKSRFTERILHIVGISPKRTARPNWLIAMMLPALVALCSWWPAVPQAANESTPLETSIVSDSVAPQKGAGLDPKIARTKMPSETAPKKDLTTFTDDLSKNVEGERLSVNMAPAQPGSVAMEVVKMNVLYIGVDNPLRIAAAGVPASELEVKLLGSGTITGKDGNYVATVTQPGEVTIRAIWRVGEEIKMVVDQKCRVKRIPDPTPKLDGEYKSRVLVADAMQQTKGIQLLLENFDFDAYCEVVSFEMTYLPFQADPISIMNYAGTWNDQVKESIKAAKIGDAFFFDNIMVKCPGDTNPRNVGGLAYKIR